MKRNKWRTGICAAFLFATQMAALASTPESKTAVLAASYLRYLLLNQVKAQGAELLQQGAPTQVAEARSRLGQWQGEFQETIRTGLESALGDNAREEFEQFVEEFTSAEKSENVFYLVRLATDTGWPGPAAAGYDAFRRWGTEQWLSGDIRNSADFLVNLEVHLAAPPELSRPANPLRDAEGATGAWDETASTTASPLQRFSNMRGQRREKVLEQAQAGMQQVSAEREAWEQEHAAEVTAKAQAEADAMRKHAERLAAADAEALEQRKNSLGAKFIRVLAGATEATVGAFTGAIGARAADEAVSAIFDKK